MRLWHHCLDLCSSLNTNIYEFVQLLLCISLVPGSETGQAMGLLPMGYLWSQVWGALGEYTKARNWQGAVVGRK